ncbi:Methanogenesis regulatory histidine kinase FilI [uncultured archaeon]|nr:Methanogenesis regulatory histidine kinase FilI [uncultured archaeon]
MALNENNSLYLETRKENEERKAAEDALRISEDKYRAIFENTGTVMLIVEEDTTISLANEEFEKLTGYTKEETEGKKSWTEFVVKDDLEKMKSQHILRRQNPDAAFKIYEFQLMNKNGQIKDILLNIDLISGTRKSIASLMDISERKRAEERLTSLLRFHNEMLDTAAIWIDMFDAEGRTTFWNLAAERISGYSRDEVLGHARIWGWLYPDSEYRSRMIDTVKCMLIKNERLENYETVIRRKDGEERIIRWHSNNFVDKEGKIVGGIGIGDDITEIKRSSEALKDSERRLTDIIDFLPDATFVIDRDGKVISWNRAIEAMTGVEARDILGKGDYEYAVPFYGIRKPILIDLVLKSDEEIERDYFNIERIGGILVGEAYMPNLEGGEAYLLGTAAALYDYRGNIVGAIESIRNITERRRAEEALRKAHDELERRVKERTAELESRNAEMERFVYTVSHELRSPLISVGGVLGFLKKDLETGDVDEAGNDFRLIGSAVARMDKLLGETLELSRIGRVANPTENVPFGEIVDEALAQTVERIHSNNVEISVGEDWPVVHADRMRLVEVLVNLIENSVKYMGNQPQPRIEIGHKLEGSRPVFFVRDNGIGIDPSQYDKVFELFYKVGRTTEGTGAGLAIVKRIIEVHGGRIWIESELGKGCIICFTLL